MCISTELSRLLHICLYIHVRHMVKVCVSTVVYTTNDDLHYTLQALDICTGTAVYTDTYTYVVYTCRHMVMCISTIVCTTHMLYIHAGTWSCVLSSPWIHLDYVQAFLLLKHVVYWSRFALGGGLRKWRFALRTLRNLTLDWPAAILKSPSVSIHSLRSSLQHVSITMAISFLDTRKCSANSNPNNGRSFDSPVWSEDGGGWKGVRGEEKKGMGPG